MRSILPFLMLASAAACGAPPDVAERQPSPCVELIDPLRDDDRTPFGLRPNQLRVQLAETRSGQTADGQPVEVTPVWTGGLAMQLWAERDPALDAPDPMPPLWCEDRAEVSARVRIVSDAVQDGVIEVPGVVAAVGPLHALRAAFIAEDETYRAWIWLDEGRGELYAQDALAVEFTLDPS